MTVLMPGASHSDRAPQFEALLLTILLILLAAAMLAPGLAVGPSLDAAVFNHIGGGLFGGLVPYVDVWDHKPPGIYLASASAQAAFGWLGPWTADWLLSLGATAGMGLAVAAVLRRLGVGSWTRTLSAAGAVVLAGHYLLALGGGLTEPLATALVATAMAVAMRTRTRLGLILAGGLLGCGLLVSVQVLPAAAAVLGLAVARQAHGIRLVSAALLLGAAGLPVGATAAWLAGIGALPAAIDALVTYSGAYRASSALYGATISTPTAASVALLSIYLVAPALAGGLGMATSSPERRAVAIVSLLWIGGSLAMIVVEGRFYAHYAIPLAVPLGILAGLGFERIGGMLQRDVRVGTRMLVLLPLVATLVVSILAGVALAGTQVAGPARQAQRLRMVSERLHALPAGTLLVWGLAPRLYDLAERNPATPYIYFFPLTTPGYSTPALIDDVARTLADEPPAVVVDAGSDAPGEPGFLPLLIPRRILTDGRDFDLLDPLRTFVAAHYTLVDTVAGWPIYVLNGGGRSP